MSTCVVSYVLFMSVQNTYVEMQRFIKNITCQNNEPHVYVLISCKLTWFTRMVTQFILRNEHYLLTERLAHFQLTTGWKTIVLEQACPYLNF